MTLGMAVTMNVVTAIIMSVCSRGHAMTKIQNEQNRISIDTKNRIENIEYSTAAGVHERT